MDLRLMIGQCGKEIYLICIKCLLRSGKGNYLKDYLTAKNILHSNCGGQFSRKCQTVEVTVSTCTLSKLFKYCSMYS